MRRTIGIIAAIAFIAVAALALAAQSHDHSKMAAAKVEVTKCPVMGGEVKDLKKAPKSVYKGKTYYFCCPGCKPKFDKNPEKYIKASKANDVILCPVMGGKVADIKKAPKSVYKGKTYYFCCPGCKPKFDKSPSTYVKPEAKAKGTCPITGQKMKSECENMQKTDHSGCPASH
ncbi:MAG: YHS domain-containing protein [Armatimonadota bacterium]|nr:YHS domain-containing protein [Armatimonadota bacterium]